MIDEPIEAEGAEGSAGEVLPEPVAEVPETHGHARPVEPEPPRAEGFYFERSESIEISAFPPADQVRQLERALPGAGDRAFRMAEQEQSHRRRLERNAQDAFIKGLHRGQFLTFVLAVLWLIASVLLILEEEQVIGVALFLGDVLFLTLAFMKQQPSFRSQSIDEQDPPSEDLQPRGE